MQFESHVFVKFALLNILMICIDEDHLSFKKKLKILEYHLDVHVYH